MGGRPSKDEFHKGELSNTIAKLRRVTSIAILAAVLCGGMILVLLNFPFWEYRHKGIENTELLKQQTAARIADNLRVKEKAVHQKPKPQAKSPPTAPSGNAEPEAPGSSEGVEMPQKVEDEIPETPQPVFSDDIKPEEQRDSEPSQFSISGWVFNQAGGRIPGVGVVASVRRLFQWHDYGAPAGSGRTQRTQTDNAGYFMFPQLPDGEYEVRTEATERYSSARAVLRAGIDSAVLVVEEEEERGVYVYGIVETTRGNLLEGVRVLPIGQRTQQATYSDETGNYGLYLAVSERRQSHTLRFMRADYREQRLTLGTADVSGGEDIRRDVRMEPIGVLATVSGTVTGPDGSPVAMASIQLLSARLKRLYQALSEQDGYFLLPAVEIAPDYRLWVRPKGRYKDYIENGLKVTVDGLDLEVVLEHLRLSSLTGRMVDVQGNPVPEFSLWLRSSSATVPPSLLVIGDQYGYFFVDELPAGKLSFQTLSSPYFSVGGIELAPDSAKEVLLTLDWGSYEAGGYVLDAEGYPVPGSQVSLSWLHNVNGVSNSARRNTTADTKGYFLFTQLGPGLHTLNINAPGFRSARLNHDVGMPGEEILVQLKAVSPQGSDRSAVERR